MNEIVSISKYSRILILCTLFYLIFSIESHQKKKKKKSLHELIYIF